jgi:hypothetical protein
MEAGVHLRLIQDNLGHGSPMTEAAKEWATLADQNEPSRRKPMAMRMSPIPKKFCRVFSPQ